MAFLIITNEIPEGGFTRSQLLNMLKTAKAGSDFYDGSTIGVNEAGALEVKEIAQSQVADLTTDLAAKQAQNALLTAIAGLSANGLLHRDSSALVSVKVIGTDVQAYSALLASIAGLNAAGIVYQDGEGAASVKVIGTDIQAFHQLLADIAGLELTEGDIIQYDGANLTNVPRQDGVDDVDVSQMPGSISNPPTQAEVEGLKAVLADTVAQLEKLRDRLKATGGNGLIADAEA